MRILVADDDRVISTVVCTLLREHGHQPMPAFDAMQAVMFAMRPPHPDAIVLDINMPGGNGVEALRKLRMSVRTMGIPVIVLTGTTDLDRKAQMRALGVIAMLPKPVEPEALLEVVADLQEELVVASERGTALRRRA